MINVQEALHKIKRSEKIYIQVSDDIDWTNCTKVEWKILRMFTKRNPNFPQ